MRRKTLLRQLIVPVTLWLCVSYVLFELVFPFLMPYLPLQLQLYLPRRLSFLAQNSKAGLFPRDYIAIAGDSYAIGVGDAQHSANRLTNPRVNPANIINEATGIDCVSFGFSGADNMDGLLFFPVERYCAANTRLWFSSFLKNRMSKPDVTLMFFYEGNDLDGNCNDIKIIGRLNMRRARRDSIVGFNRNYRPGHLTEAKVPLLQRLIFARFLANCIYDPEGLRKKSPLPDVAAPGQVNKVFVDGQVIDIPDHLQSPSLAMTDEEIKIGLNIFEDAVVGFQEYFPDTKIIIVYVPSPLSSYFLACSEVSVETYIRNRKECYSVQKVVRNNSLITEAVAGIAARHGAVFVDTLPFVRRASRKELIHGPRDWRHFNYKGYRVMCEPVIDAIKKIVANKKSL